MARIDQALSERTLTLSGTWDEDRKQIEEYLNREVHPMLRALRRAVNGPLKPSVEQAADYRILLSDELVVFGGAIALAAYLPTDAPVGHCSYIASVGSFAVTVTAPDGETVEGAATVALSTGCTSKYVKVTEIAWHRLQ